MSVKDAAASRTWSADEERSRLAVLYERQAPDAIRLAVLLTGDRALAEDLVQEAFAKLVGRLAHLREPDAIGAYLRKAVVNQSRMHFRRRKVERASMERLGSRPASSIGGSDLDEREAMAQALMRLPERQRAAIVLRFYEDLSERQAAEVLGCRPGTVGSLVSRGFDTLRPLVRGD
ncbi:MAG: SigE family RNA polymerase sigma factor [Actinomycetota bacterium]|nr:SigE family RNA polymerase sigma factor [Actinomycetota bacterium]